MPAMNPLEIHDAALAITDPESRRRYLDEACGGDADVLGRVEEMLGISAVPTELLGRQMFAATMPLPGTDTPHAPVSAGADPLLGTVIGGVTLQRVVGQGGMGRVYVGLQASTGRPVAVKLLMPHVVSEAMLKRFDLEAKLLGRLRHPGIAQIHSAGTYGSGSTTFPYFVMEYIADALPITSYAEVTGLDTSRRLELFRKACEAVAHGHEHGVIHRDLKPANLLVDRFGQPKVIDFGVAKCTDTDLGGTMATAQGGLIGTLRYMSPEQARGDHAGITVRSDVHALGVILYELLAGRLPFEFGDPSMASMPRVLQIIQLQEARSLPTANRGFPRDLVAIVAKSLEKAPSSRYASAAEFAADVSRHLDGLPVMARRATSAERAWKWARRRPAVAMLIVVSALAMVSMAVGGVFYADAANRRAELVTRELEEQRAIIDTRAELLAAVDRARDRLASGDLTEADKELRVAAARAGSAEAFARERGAIDGLRAEFDRLAAADAQRSQTRARLEAFAAHRDKAIFHGSQSASPDPTADARLAAEEARAGLALWDHDERAGGPILPEGMLSSDEERRVLSQCEELLLLLADALVRSAGDRGSHGDIVAEAERVIDRCVRLKGRESRATHLARAECRRAAGDVPGAEAEIGRSEAATEAATAAEHFLVGRLWMQHEPAHSVRFQQAKHEFEQALIADPDHFWAQYSLGSHALRSDRPDIAEVHLTACIGRRPDFAWPWILRGQARTALGEHALAAADFEKGLALTTDPEARHAALAAWAIDDTAAGRLDDAREKLREAIALAPARHEAHLTLANLEQAAGDESAALAALGAAARLAPDAPIVRRERAKLHARAGRHRIAEEDLEEAVRLQPAGAPALVGDLSRLAQARFHQGRLDAALTTWDRALASDPHHADSHLGRAMALIESSRLEEAADALDAYVRDGGSRSTEFHGTRAACRGKLGDYAGAIDDWSRAIEITPGPEPYTQRGWLYALVGHPLIGLQDFDRALKTDPDHAEAHAGRGLALAYLGKHADAVAAAERSLRDGERTFPRLFKAAAVCATAATRVVFADEERRRQGPTERQLSIRYLSRAAELLEEALSLEAPERRARLWEDVIAKDARFQGLLSEPEFRSVWRGIFEVDPQVPAESAPPQGTGADSDVAGLPGRGER